MHLDARILLKCRYSYLVAQLFAMFYPNITARNAVCKSKGLLVAAALGLAITKFADNYRRGASTAVVLLTSLKSRADANGDESAVV